MNAVSRRRRRAMVAVAACIPAIALPTQASGEPKRPLAPTSTCPGGKLAAWGSGASGQIGHGAAASSQLPTGVSFLGVSGGVRSVAGGFGWATAVSSDGAVYSWGAGSGTLTEQNQYGQLGSGIVGGARTVPGPVSGLGPGSGVIAVAAGAVHGLALKADGTVLSWGSGAHGQLGSGATTDRLAPAEVTGLGTGSGVVAIAAQADSSMALKGDGTVLSWGLGPLGDGSDPPLSSNVPVQAAGLGPGSDVVAIARGVEHGVALKADGTVLSWGRNVAGALGDGSGADRNRPAGVRGLGPGSGVVQVGSGAHHTLALRASGSVVAWGYNGDGALGNGDLIGRSQPTPVGVSGLGSGSGVTSIAVGYGSSLALKADGTVASWGATVSLGDYQPASEPSSYAVHSPVVIPTLSSAGVTKIASGYYENFAVTDQPVPVRSLRLTSGSPQNAVRGDAFRIPLTAVVSPPEPGQPVQFRSEDSAVTFTGGSRSATVTPDSSGTAVSPPFSATGAVGEHLITARMVRVSGQDVATGGAVTFETVTITGGPGVISGIAGTRQSTTVSHPYASRFTVQALSAGSPQAGVTVTFSAPTSGPSGTFAGGSLTAAVTTDGSGTATAPAFTANAVAGDYAVTASAPGLSPDARFDLTSTSPGVRTCTGSGQSAAPQSAFSAPLVARVSDVDNRPLDGLPVTFTALSAGAGARFAGGATTATVNSDASGAATSPPLTANASQGSYTVLAGVAGGTQPTGFTLTNGPLVLVTSSGNSVPLGQTLQATAHLDGGITPSGIVSFALFGPNDPSCVGTPATNSPVPARGNADYQSAAFTPSAAGIYRWRASYSGDSQNNGSGPSPCDDPAARATVTKARAALTARASDPGTTITDTATLGGPDAASGSMDFDLFKPTPDAPGCSGSPIFHSSRSVAAPTSSYTSEAFAPTSSGTYIWVASYSGDASTYDAGPTSCADSSQATTVKVLAPQPQPSPTPSGTPAAGGSPTATGAPPTATSGVAPDAVPTDVAPPGFSRRSRNAAVLPTRRAAMPSTAGAGASRPSGLTSSAVPGLAQSPSAAVPGKPLGPPVQPPPPVAQVPAAPGGAGGTSAITSSRSQSDMGLLVLPAAVAAVLALLLGYAFRGRLRRWLEGRWPALVMRLGTRPHGPIGDIRANPDTTGHAAPETVRR